MLSYLYSSIKSQAPVVDQTDPRIIALRNLVKSLSDDLYKARANLELCTVDNIVNMRLTLNAVNYIEKRLGLYKLILHYVEDNVELLEVIGSEISNYEVHLLNLFYSSEDFSYSEQIKLQHEISITTDKYQKQELMTILKIYNINITFYELDLKCKYLLILNAIQGVATETNIIVLLLRYKLMYIEFTAELNSIIAVLQRVGHYQNRLQDETLTVDQQKFLKKTLARDQSTLLEFELRAYLTECKLRAQNGEEVITKKISSRYANMLTRCVEFHIAYYHGDESRYAFEIDRSILKEIHAILMEIKHPALESLGYILSQVRPVTFYELQKPALKTV